MKSDNALYIGLLPLFAALLVAGGCNKQTTPEIKSADKVVTQPKQPLQPVMNAAPAAEIPEVIIEVNGEKLTREAAEAEIAQMLAGAGSTIPPERMPEIKLRIIDQLIERFVVKTLLMSEVKKANLTALPEEIDQRLAEIKTSISNSKKGLTFEEILKKNGITEEKVREDIGTDVKINKLFGPVTNGITVTDAEVSEYIEKNKEAISFPESVRASHILVGVAKTDDEKTKAEKKTKINNLKEQLDKGANFEALAKENSDCPSKEMGGDLGEFQKGRMTKIFEEAAFSQATNIVGSVVETEFGYHLIKVTEHKQAGMPPKEEVSTTLLRQKFDEARRKYISSLAEKANIKNNMPQRMMPSPMGMGMPGTQPAPSAPAPLPSAPAAPPAPQK